MSVEDVVRYYQALGFFTGAEPADVIQSYAASHGSRPDPGKPWDDVFLLALSEDDVWSDDPEADVCAENQVYSEILAEWARISRGAFTPTGITEDWESESGPIIIRFQLGGQAASLSPAYLDDRTDLDVLRQINSLIAQTGREFAYAIDGNFALVVCLTHEQKKKMIEDRGFPFAW